MKIGITFILLFSLFYKLSLPLSSNITNKKLPNAFPYDKDVRFFQNQKEIDEYLQSIGGLVEVYGVSTNNYKMQKERITYATQQHFQKLKLKALQKGIFLHICDGYRSFNNQAMQKRVFKNRAESPGWSEHHLGTTIDILKISENSEGFLFLLENGFAEGFVPTYYFNNQRKIRIKEPWHWRYLGKQRAETFYKKYRIQITSTIKRLKRVKLQKNHYYTFYQK